MLAMFETTVMIDTLHSKRDPRGVQQNTAVRCWQCSRPPTPPWRFYTLHSKRDPVVFSKTPQYNAGNFWDTTVTTDAHYRERPAQRPGHCRNRPWTPWNTRLGLNLVRSHWVRSADSDSPGMQVFRPNSERNLHRSMYVLKTLFFFEIWAIVTAWLFCAAVVTDWRLTIVFFYMQVSCLMIRVVSIRWSTEFAAEISVKRPTNCSVPTSSVEVLETRWVFLEWIRKLIARICELEFALDTKRVLGLIGTEKSCPMIVQINSYSMDGQTRPSNLTWW